tara:strand:+ start:123 stop:1199 length:1077 start_codon:yes stop_codon:yes gene_type:complete
MITFTPRDKISNYWTLIGPILSIFLTIAFGLLIFTFLGFDPTETLYQIFISPFSRIDRISDILVKSCPLIIVGIGLMFCFRANVWNIGAEGQFIMGTLLAGSFALLFPNVETKLLIICMMFIGFIGGALWAFIPAILKTRLNVNEILVTLMLVYVAMLFIDFIVRGPLRDPMSFGFPLSKPYPDGALINKISFPGIGYLGQLHYGILFIIFLIPLSWIFINKTLGGFQINVLGSAPKAARFAGFSQDKITMTVLLLAGGLAGVAGVIEVSANIGQLQPEVSFGYGFTAIIVAFLGRLSPVGILIAGIIIATVKLGADNAQMTMGVPKVVTGLFEGILLFFLLTGETLQKYKIKWSWNK